MRKKLLLGCFLIASFAMIASVCNATQRKVLAEAPPPDDYEAELIDEFGESEQFRTLSEAIGVWRETQTIKLLKDVSSSTIFIEGSKRFDLNGHTLIGYGNGPVFSVVKGALSLKGQGVVTGGYSSSGGGFFISDGELEIEEATVKGNRASLYGGGIYLEGDSLLKMTGGSIEDNEAAYGGAVCIHEGNAELLHGKIVNNHVSVNGGGIYVYGSNRSTSIDLSGDFELSQNSAEDYGGGICVWMRAQLTVSDGATITKNHAKKGGGGVFLHGVVGDGAESSMTLLDGLLSENWTEGDGGGIEIVYGGRLQMNGGTIVRNQGNHGSGIMVSYNGSAAFARTAKVSENQSIGGEASNVYLASSELITIERGFTGEIGIGMEADGVISSGYSSDSAEGLFSDREGYELRVEEGKLYFGNISSLSPSPEAPKSERAAAETAVMIIIVLAALAAIAVLGVGFFVYFFEKRRA